MVTDLWGELGLCISVCSRLSWWGNAIHLFGRTPQNCVQALLWKARSLNGRKSNVLWILMPSLLWSFFVGRLGEMTGEMP